MLSYDFNQGERVKGGITKVTRNGEPNDWSQSPKNPTTDECTQQNEGADLYPPPRSFFCQNKKWPYPIKTTNLGIQEMKAGDTFKMTVIGIDQQLDNPDLYHAYYYNITVINCTEANQNLEQCPKFINEVRENYITSPEKSSAGKFNHPDSKKYFVRGFQYKPSFSTRDNILSLKYADVEAKATITANEYAFFERPIYAPQGTDYVVTNLNGFTGLKDLSLRFVFSTYEADYCKMSQCINDSMEYLGLKCNGFDATTTELAKWYSKCQGKMFSWKTALLSHPCVNDSLRIF